MDRQSYFALALQLFQTAASYLNQKISNGNNLLGKDLISMVLWPLATFEGFFAPEKEISTRMQILNSKRNYLMI